MALSDRVTTVKRKHSGTPCSVRYALDNLPPDEAAVFAALLGTPERRGEEASVIYELMQAERRDLLAQATAKQIEADGAECAEAVVRLTDERDALMALADVYDVAHQTINRHRGNRCRCSKDAA